MGLPVGNREKQQANVVVASIAGTDNSTRYWQPQ